MKDITKRLESIQGIIDKKKNLTKVSNAEGTSSKRSKLFQKFTQVSDHLQGRSSGVAESPKTGQDKGKQRARTRSR